MKKQICDCDAQDTEIVEKIKQKLEKCVDTALVSNFFKVIGDETRLKILLVLSENRICVNDIAVILDMTKSAVSHQLKILKDFGHVKAEKVGKNVYYSINDNHVVQILNQAIAHLSHI